MINKKAKNTYYKKFDKVYIFSNSFKTITEEIKLPIDRIYDGISELQDVVESLYDDDKVLIILDDCISDIKNDKFMMKLIYNRRHIAGGISIIIATQVYNKLALSLRKCANDLVLYNTSNKRELDSIYEDYICLEKKVYFDLVRYCFKDDKHTFIWIKNETGRFFKNFNEIIIK